LLDGASETSHKRVCTRCHDITLTSMMGLTWASMVIHLIEQARIVEGELIQIASEKCLNPSSHSSFVVFSTSDQFGGSGR
jgi:hypothetical protein